MKGWILYNYGVLLDWITGKLTDHADKTWNRECVFNFCQKNGLMQPQEITQPEPDFMHTPEVNFTREEEESAVLQSILQTCEDYEFYEICEAVKQQIEKK